VQVLKVDRSFVEGLGRDRGDEAIVAAITSMARKLGMEVVAEGVETAEQLAESRALGCHVGQGYYFARPQPAEAISAWRREPDASFIGTNRASRGAEPVAAG
jgi:EAL domain-containing protein (putative c-di-GMP-specific phosphodiesterase class I)